MIVRLRGNQWAEFQGPYSQFISFATYEWAKKEINCEYGPWNLAHWLPRKRTIIKS
jgi:hypothetical protein